MSELTCGFIGLGLIGGSIAKALRAAFPDVKIIAYDTNPETLSLAAREGIADVCAPGITPLFSECHYLFLCAPVSHNDRNLEALKTILSPGCILTDVGSVKSTTHAHVAAAGLSRQFIGGHPMAGSERIGYQNSKALLLQNAYYILTPSAEVPYDRLLAMQNLVKKLGAIPLVLSCEQHDFVTAAISHLPHVVAASLVNMVRETDTEDGIMKQIAAGGFKDITRIASSSPIMWQQICLTNGENISRLLSAYIDLLMQAKTALDRRDAEALYRLFSDARTYRESFSNASAGPIKRVFDLTVDIADKPGSIAAIVTLLASQGLNIKNIGITHNREVAEGAMRIEFYEEADVAKGAALLKDNGYETFGLSL